MIASIFFIATLPSVELCSMYYVAPCVPTSCRPRDVAGGSHDSLRIPIAKLRRDRIAPVLAEAARRDAYAHRGLAALVFVQLDEPHHQPHVLGRVTSGDDFFHALV